MDITACSGVRNSHKPNRIEWGIQSTILDRGRFHDLIVNLH
jgi:hypothetical protein